MAQDDLSEMCLQDMTDCQMEELGASGPKLKEHATGSGRGLWEKIPCLLGCEIRW